MHHRLIDFERWINELLYLKSITDFDTRYYIDEIRMSVERQFTRKDKQRSYIGASALSRPDVLLGLMRLQYPHITTPYTIKTALTFHLGDIFESLIVTLMNAYGLKVTNEQLEIRIPNTSVFGHIDGMVEELDAVIEVKTMASSYFKSFIKNPNNFRGYITQLAIYKHCTGKSNAFWVCFDKESSKVAIVEPDEEVLNEHWENAKSRAELIKQFNSLDDVASLTVPDPRPEVYRKEETGKLLIPVSMRYTPYYPAFYETYEATDGYRHKKTYVSRIITDTNKRIEKIQQIKQEVCDIYGCAS